MACPWTSAGSCKTTSSSFWESGVRDRRLELHKEMRLRRQQSAESQVVKQEGNDCETYKSNSAESLPTSSSTFDRLQIRPSRTNRSSCPSCNQVRCVTLQHMTPFAASKSNCSCKRILIRRMQRLLRCCSRAGMNSMSHRARSMLIARERCHSDARHHHRRMSHQR